MSEDCDCSRRVDDERYERDRADDDLRSDIRELERTVEALRDRVEELERAREES